jgi:hypothetical protein
VIRPFMSRLVAVCTFLALSSAALPARADAKGDVEAAVKKLSDASSYAWTSKTEGGFGGGTAEGKAEKDGLTWVSMAFANNTIEVVKKGDKGAVKMEDGWKSFEEAEEGGTADQPNRGRFIAGFLRNYKAPAAIAGQLVGGAKEVKASGDAGTFEAELTEAGAKEMLSFRGRQGGDAPAVSGAKGTTKFWVKDGAVSKLEYHLQGSIHFHGQDRDIDRTTTIEIKDVGSAKVEVPEEAKKKLG